MINFVRVPCLSIWYSMYPNYPEERVRERIQLDLPQGGKLITDVECPRIKVDVFIAQRKLELLIYNPN